MPDIHNCGNFVGEVQMGGMCENSTHAHLFCKFKTVLKHSRLIKKQGLPMLSVKKDWRPVKNKDKETN